MTRLTLPTCRAHYPDGPERVRLSVASPLHSGLPRYSGGSASTTSLSRPAQASLTLRPAGSLNRPRRPLSRGFGPPGCPDKPLVRYQVLPTTSWVDPSSTGEPRRWGALRNPGYVLTSILDNDTSIDPEMHTTDTYGFTESLWGLCY